MLQLDEGDKLLEAGEDTFLTQVDSIISAGGPSLSAKRHPGGEPLARPRPAAPRYGEPLP